MPINKSKQYIFADLHWHLALGKCRHRQTKVWKTRKSLHMNRLSQSLPSPMATTPLTTQPLYLSAPDAVPLVRRLGLQNCIAGIAQHIRADFLRWPNFDKSARVANHSKEGVIELMPVSDDTAYSFK